MTYGHRLKQALIFSKKSRKMLALELDCSPQAIGMVITWTGEVERRLSTEAHAMAAAYLGVSPQWLLTGDGDMEPPSLSAQDRRKDAKLSMHANKLAFLFDLMSEGLPPQDAYMAAHASIIESLRALRKPPIDTPAPLQSPETQRA